jgi:hypothetical protein
LGDSPTLEHLEGRKLPSGLATPAALLPYVEQDNLVAKAEPGRSPGGGTTQGIIAILIGL